MCLAYMIWYYYVVYGQYQLIVKQGETISKFHVQKKITAILKNPKYYCNIKVPFQGKGYLWYVGLGLGSQGRNPNLECPKVFQNQNKCVPKTQIKPNMCPFCAVAKVVAISMLVVNCCFWLIMSYLFFFQHCTGSSGNAFLCGAIITIKNESNHSSFSSQPRGVTYCFYYFCFCCCCYCCC